MAAIAGIQGHATATSHKIESLGTERLALLNMSSVREPPSRVRLSAEEGVGLLDVTNGDTILLPKEAVRMTRSIEDLDFLLRIKLAALEARQPAIVGKRERFLAGLAGLYVSEAVSGRDRIDRSRPIPYVAPSELDNAPVPSDPGKLKRLLWVSLAKARCQKEAIDFLRRVAGTSPPEMKQSKTARDGREILRLLGALAYHPPANCAAKPSDPSYSEMVEAIDRVANP